MACKQLVDSAEVRWRWNTEYGQPRHLQRVDQPAFGSDTGSLNQAIAGTTSDSEQVEASGGTEQTDVSSEPEPDPSENKESKEEK